MNGVNQQTPLIQVALGNSHYATALSDQLARAGGCEVELVDRPDYGREGVFVIDAEQMDACGVVIAPERIVLIARNDPALLSRAWDAGINSVVFERDPISTAVLAIMAAKLRSATSADERVP